MQMMNIGATIALFLVLLASAVTVADPAYALGGALFGTVLVLALVAAARRRPGRIRPAGPLVRTGRALLFRSPEKLWLVLVAGFAVVCASVISHRLFGAIPHIEDSVAQYFHAKLMAQGQVTMPSHPLPEFFDAPTIINDGRWHSQYPPGHIAILAIGHLFGVPWLINPLLAGLAVIAVYYLALALHGARTARVASLLAALSPFILFMSAEYMNHATGLLFTTLFALNFVKADRERSLGRAVLAGASMGMVFLTRPYSAAVIGVPFVVYGLWRWPRDVKGYLRSYVTMGIVFACFFGAQLWFNHATNGDPFVYGYERLHGPTHRPGFGEISTQYGIEVHSFCRGVEQACSNVRDLSQMLFEWPITSLVFIVVALLCLRVSAWHLVFLCSMAGLVFAYIYHYALGIAFGPRFYYEVVGLLIVVSAYGVMQTPRLLLAVLGLPWRRRAVFATTAALIGVFFLYGLIANLPARWRGYEYYWGVHSFFLHKIEKQYQFENALVFVSATYRNVYTRNPPTEDAPVIYARDLGTRNQALMEHYPQRDVYQQHGGEFVLIRAGGSQD
jgi:hypothetical protein